MPANRSPSSQLSAEQRLAELLQRQRTRWRSDVGELLAIKQAALETKEQFDKVMAAAVELQHRQRAELHFRRKAALGRGIIAQLVIASRLKMAYQQCMTAGVRCRRRLVRRLTRIRPLQRAFEQIR